MGPFAVVASAPAFDDDLGFSEGLEDLAVQQFVLHVSIEALAVAFLLGEPGSTWAAALTAEIQSLTVWATNFGSMSERTKAVTPRRMNRSLRVSDDIGRVQLSRHSDDQPFAAEFVSDFQVPERLAIVGPVGN